MEIRKDFTRQVTSWMNSSKLNGRLQVALGKSVKQMAAQAREAWQQGASCGAQLGHRALAGGDRYGGEGASERGLLL